jgi:hypothetical protein
VSDLTLDESGTANVALDEAWRQLAPRVDEAKRLQADAARDPDLLTDAWTVALIRWANVFEREIAAVQKVHEASSRGGRMAPGDVRTATDVAHKLLHFADEARNRTSSSVSVSSVGQTADTVEQSP